MPTTKIGAKIDALRKAQIKMEDIQREMSKWEKQLAKAKAVYEKIETEIFDAFDKESIDGAKGKTAAVSVSKKVVANIVDPNKVYAYIKKTSRFDLLQRRVNNAVYEELSKNGKVAIPGLATFTKVSLKLKPNK